MTLPRADQAPDLSDAVKQAADLGAIGTPLRFMIRWTRLLASHRILLSIVLIALGLIFSTLSAGIAWQADILQFFASDSADVKNVRSASEHAGISSFLRFDVHGESPAISKPAITAAAHDLAALLQNTGEFRSVWTGPDLSQMTSAYAALVAQGPALLTDAQREEIEFHATADYLQKRFAAVREKLADPDGELLLQQLRADPLNLGNAITSALQSLSPANAKNATLDDGALLTQEPNGTWHAMLVADPISLPSDQRAAEKTVAAVGQTLATFRTSHPTLGVWYVGAHRGYVDNAQRVKADVTHISLLGTLLVALAIALYFRRISTALLCIIPPAVGLGIALGLSGLFNITLPLLLLGFAGLLSGSTTDYGIQIIAECRRLAATSGGWNPDLPAIAAHRLLGPISMSVATSVTGFATLGLSDAPGLRALGLFVAAATLSIWAITFLILPAYLGPWIVPKKKVASSKQQVGKRGAISVLLATCYLLLTLALARAALHIRFNTDPRALDGSSPSLLADEENFSRVWGDVRNRAVVLAEAPTPAACLTQLATLTAYLQDLQRDGLIANLLSPAGILPDERTAAARATQWTGDWTNDRRSQLRDALRTAALANRFKPAPFLAYADHLQETHLDSPDNRLAHSPVALLPGFLSLSPTHATAAIIVSLRTDRSSRLATGWIQELRLRYPDAVVLCGQALIFDATERARAEAERLAPLCILAILLPLLAYFRRLRTAWLALTSLIVGFLWVLAAATLFGNGLNLLSLVPVLFTLGVAVDYGVYAASDPAWKSDGKNNRLAATSLCATTTLLGSGALLLAVHPALRWLGITLVAGILGGYLTSLFIVAPLTRWSHHRKRRRFSKFTRLAVNTALALLTLLLLIPPTVQFILAHEQPRDTTLARETACAIQAAPRTYTFENSWMRWHETSSQSGLWEIAAVGTPQQRGRALAALASPIDVRIENEMLDQLDYFLPNKFTRYLLLRGVAANLMTLPRYVSEEDQREIFAAATGYRDPHAYLAPSYPRILSYHALHDISQMLIDNPLIVPNTFACTGLVSLPSYSSAKMNGDLFLARVFDFEGGESFGRQKSITYMIPPAGEGIPFAHVAWPGLAGAVTGMNAEKIGLFINAAATKDFARIGTPTILMARDILEHAHSLPEADSIFRKTSTFVSDILVVADGKTGEVRIFEKSPARLDSYPVTDSAVVTNHLITPTFARDPVNKERRDEGTTTQRYARARQLLDRLHGKITPESLATLLRDKRGLDDKDLGYGNRNTIDGLIACHAVIMDVSKGEMWVASWPNAEGAFVGVDVMAMLKQAAANPNVHAPPSPALIAADPMMADGTWEAIVASRVAADDAERALHEGRAADAARLAQTVVKNNPRFYLGHELLGRAAFASGDRVTSKGELARALQLDPPYTGRRAAIEGLIRQCDTP